MAELTKIVIKSIANELFTPQNYKVYPILIDSPLWDSLDNQSSLSDTGNIKKLDINRVVGIHYEGEMKSISELNNQADFTSINILRNPDITYTNVLSTIDSTLESIPEHFHILEQIENMERMKLEYSSKLNMLDYLVDNMFDIDYAREMYMVGRGTQIFVDENDRFVSVDTRISGYIKAENTPIDITLNFVFRGVPVPMRRTLTSENTDVEFNVISYNYIFTYPQYMLDNIDLIQSIQYIEVNDQGMNSIFWYGTTYDFTLTNYVGFGANLANLHLINKDGRNLVGDIESNS